MAAGDVADRIGHGDDAQAERQRHADQADTDLRKPAAMTALPHPAKVSQNVPIASAVYFWCSLLASRMFCVAGC